MPGELEVEKPQGQTPAEAAAKAPAASKSVVGIIYPPPEVRSILNTFARLFPPGAHVKNARLPFQLMRTIGAASISVCMMSMYVCCFSGVHVEMVGWFCSPQFSCLPDLPVDRYR